MVYALLALATGVAAFVQGAVGIGFALIVGPVMGFLWPELIPVSLLLLMLPLNVYVGLREYRAIDWKGVAWVSLGRLPGALAGVWILVLISAGSLGQLIGAATVIAVLVALWAPVFQPGAGSCLAAGVVTGVTETATGVGGPPLALLYQHQPGPILRATIALCFLVGQIVSLALLAAAGQYNDKQLLLALLLLPPLLLGSLASRLVYHRVDARRLRLGVLWFALLSGLILLVPR